MAKKKSIIGLGRHSTRQANVHKALSRVMDKVLCRYPQCVKDGTPSKPCAPQCQEHAEHWGERQSAIPSTGTNKA